MAITVLEVYADRSNRLLLRFSADLDPYGLELGTGVLTAADSGSVPSLVSYDAVSGLPDELYATFDGPLRQVGHVLAYGGLAGILGDVAAGVTATFSGLGRSGPRRFPYDQRLRIDLDFNATLGGDLSLLVGDSLVKEQVYRLLAWREGELLADPSFGVPFRFQGPASSRRLLEYKAAAERKIRALPGVTRASVRLEQTDDVLKVFAAVQTSQTELEVAVQRQLGR